MDYETVALAKPKLKLRQSTVIYNFSRNFIRKYAILVCVCFVIGYYMIYEKRNMDKLNFNTAQVFQRSLSFKKFSPTNASNDSDKWQYIGDPKLRYQMYSAYFDSRLQIVENVDKSNNHLAYGSVRILAVLPIETNYKNVQCNFRYTNLRTEKGKRVAAISVSAVHENYNMEFSAFFIVCPLTTDVRDRTVYLPETVGITIDNIESMHEVTSLVKIRYPQNVLLEKEEKNIAVCVAPAHHQFSNVLRIVEFVEIYRSLGVEKFYFYNDSITSDVDKIFRYYRDIGIANILQWNFEGYEFEKEVRYEGIFVALNDCVYRATFLDNFKYTVVVDYDEIIIPFGTSSLTKFLAKHDNEEINSFSFRSTFFYFFFRADFSTVPNNTVNDFLYTQVQITRQQTILPKHQRTKYIVKGQYAIEMGNHFIWDSLDGKREFEVDTEEALVFHYRDSCIVPCSVDTEIIDDRARIFDSFLWNSVDYVCTNNFPSGICPMDVE